MAQLNTDLQNRCITTTPYFNPQKTATQALSANGNTYLYFNDISNETIRVETSIGNQYFSLKKTGNYRFIFHVATGNVSTDFTLELKNAGNSVIYKSCKGSECTSLEIMIYNRDEASYLFNLKSNAAVTLYSDTRYCWLEIEYLGI